MHYDIYAQIWLGSGFDTTDGVDKYQNVTRQLSYHLCIHTIINYLAISKQICGLESEPGFYPPTSPLLLTVTSA